MPDSENRIANSSMSSKSEAVRSLADMADRANRIVLLTGAGISTESGLPDFRSPSGIWTRYRMIDYSEFLSSSRAREEYWRRYLEFYPPFKNVKPNAGHLALVELGKIKESVVIITQNIDGLHQAAGSPEETVIELHGRIDKTRCLTCGKEWNTEDIVESLLRRFTPPACDSCNGLLKPATISFGQQLPEKALERSFQSAEQSDLFISVGSSLTVYPAASLPSAALNSGSKLVIVNAESTPWDQHAHLVVHDSAGKTLSGMINLMQRSK